MNSSPATDNPWKTITGQAVDLYGILSTHPHYETHEIYIEGECRRAYRLHSMPHIALLEDALAIRPHGELIHTRIEFVEPDMGLHLEIADAIAQSVRHASVPVQQQWN